MRNVQPRLRGRLARHGLRSGKTSVPVVSFKTGLSDATYPSTETLRKPLTRGINGRNEVEMVYVITDLKMVEIYSRIKADSGKDALEEFALSNGFFDLMDFASAHPAFAHELIAVQLQ